MWAKLKRQVWEWRGVLVIAPTVATLVIVLRLTGLLQLLEWGAFDQLVRLRPLEPLDERILIVGVTESDLQKIGRGIVPDGVLAQLLQQLKQQQPTAIGLDIYRDLPEEPGHEALVEVYKSTPNLIGIKRVIGNTTGFAVNPPPELSKQGQISANDFALDADLKIRRAYLFLTPKDGQTIEGFGLKLAFIYLKNQGIEPKEVPGTQYMGLGKAVFIPFESNDGGYVNQNAAGYQILFNFRGPAKSFRTVSIMDVLENRVPSEWIKNRLVLIGHTAPSKNDFFSTPYSSAWFGFPQPTAGVEVHANLTSQMLSSAIDGRPTIKTWADPVEWLWIFVWSAIGATLSWGLRYAGGVAKFSPQTAISFLLAGGTLLGISYFSFTLGWWIPLVPPMLALAGSAIAVTGYLARTASDIRKTFGRYLTDEVVASLLESPDGLKFGGERRRITIFTSDLRGFTSLSERLPPEKVVSILNIYLGAMADIIMEYQGTIDEFMGDGILVLFGAPTQREDDAQRAVACGVAMQLAMAGVNAQMKQMELPDLQMGIGINTGEVVVGNIGSQKRTKYGIVGSQVNLTYRIESYTVGGQILITESTLQEAGAIVKIDGQQQVSPKGVKEPITIYSVAGVEGKYNIFLSKEQDTFVTLKEELLFQYTLLDGKNVGETLHKGSIVKLSESGAQICSDYSVKPLTNIKLNLLIADRQTEPSADVYAKVLASTESEKHFSIRFTSVPQDVATILNDLYLKSKAG